MGTEKDEAATSLSAPHVTDIHMCICIYFIYVYVSM